MRGVLVALAAVFALTAAPARAAAASTAPTITSPTVFALQQQPPSPVPDKTIDINVTHTQVNRWYANPVWIAIGAVAAVVVLLLIVLAARGGGGTTIVKD